MKSKDNRLNKSFKRKKNSLSKISTSLKSSNYKNWLNMIHSVKLNMIEEARELTNILLKRFFLIKNNKSH